MIDSLGTIHYQNGKRSERVCMMKAGQTSKFENMTGMSMAVNVTYEQYSLNQNIVATLLTPGF